MTTALPEPLPDPPGHDAVDCAVVIVTYNSAQHISSLLDSLPAAAGTLRIRCLVVDNASQDDTVAQARGRPGVSVIEAGDNLGYAGAINLGRAQAPLSASVLVLNPDVDLEPGAISRLHQALAEPGVGLAVPMMLSEDGSLDPNLRREPTSLRVVGDALLGDRLARRPGWLSEMVRDDRAYREARDTAWAAGAVVMISADCFDAVGDWDEERFFMYSEETDFAARARRAGYRIRYVPGSRVRHEEGGSGRSPALAALLAVNRVRYYEKYHRRGAAAVFRSVVAFQYLLRCHRPAERAALRALVSRSGWADLPGGRA